MAEPAPTLAEIRAQKQAEIDRINRHLASGITESREEDEQAKWNLAVMQERRDELQAELDAVGVAAAPSRIRHIRVIGRKGL